MGDFKDFESTIDYSLVDFDEEFLVRVEEDKEISEL